MGEERFTPNMVFIDGEPFETGELGGTFSPVADEGAVETVPLPWQPMEMTVEVKISRRMRLYLLYGWAAKGPVRWRMRMKAWRMSIGDERDRGKGRMRRANHEAEDD